MGPGPPIGKPLAAVLQARAPMQAQAQQPMVPQAMARARAWGAMAGANRAAQAAVGGSMAWAKGAMVGAIAQAGGAMAGATARSLPRDLIRAEQALAGTVARESMPEGAMAERDLSLGRPRQESTPQLLLRSSIPPVQRAFHFRNRGARAMPRRAGPRRGAHELGVPDATSMCYLDTGLRMAMPRTHASV